MFMPGPSRTPTPSARHSSPSATPTASSSSAFHEEARPTAGGKQVAGTESLMPMWSDAALCLRTPCGPSVSITSGRPASSIAGVCQKSTPPVRLILAWMSVMGNSSVPFGSVLVSTGSTGDRT